MANTYTQLYIQIVFAVKGRMNAIHEANRERIEKYMSGIVQNNDHKLLAIYCMPDHCHILIGYDPVQALSDLVRDVKAGSSKWINEQKMNRFRFSWQQGFGAFSYSRSHLDRIIRYIRNQPEHHKRKTFKEEYLELLNKFDVDYDEKYLFKWYR